MCGAGLALDRRYGCLAFSAFAAFAAVLIGVLVVVVVVVESRLGVVVGVVASVLGVVRHRENDSTGRVITMYITMILD